MSGAGGLSDAAVERLRRVLEETEEPAAGRYRLAEPLGHGGMAVVYRAHDEVLDREVALKVLPRQPAGAGSELARRLRQEARVLARLDHPGIVPVHDLGVLPDGRLFYAMQLVRGRRLDEAAGGPPAGARAEGERLRIFERICEAVALAHDRGVVHRDLKPDNVMIGAFGEVLVMDWGVAKVIAEAGEPAAGDGPAVEVAASRPGGTAHGTVLGTPGFMAPEQERGETARQDRRADVYALGALLVWLLTGREPSPDADHDLPAASLPAPLASVAAKALAADPADRYPGAGELAAEISRYRAALSPAAHRERPFERLARVARRYRLAIGLVLAYLLMRVLLLAIAGV